MEYSINLDKKVQNEFHKKMKINSLISFIIGSVLFLAFMVAFGIIVDLSLRPAEWVYTILEIDLCVGVCMLSCGLVIYVSITKGDKKIVNNNIQFNCEFYEDYFILTINSGETRLFAGDIGYINLTKIKETKNYIFMCLSSRVAIPIPKNEFSEEELLNIKLLLYSPKVKLNGKL